MHRIKHIVIRANQNISVSRKSIVILTRTLLPLCALSQLLLSPATNALEQSAHRQSLAAEKSTLGRSIAREQSEVVQNSSSTLGDKLYNNAVTVLESATDVHYAHAKVPADSQVQFGDRDGSCTAHNDCSGFISYLLNRDAPKHYSALQSAQPNANYPQAKTYTHFFSELTTNPQGGWQKIEHIAELKRGDLIAWAKPKPPGEKRGNTGHVMMVADPPQTAVEETVEGAPVRYVSVRVIDSSSVDHFPPDQLPPHAGQQHRDGVGKGMVRIILDSTDKPIGYWEGTYWNEGQKPIEHPTYTAEIGFARLVSVHD